MLFISFNEAEITEQSTNIQNSVHQYNRRFSSEPRTVSIQLLFILKFFVLKSFSFSPHDHGSNSPLFVPHDHGCNSSL
jgi:hypothetical protein